MFLPAQGRRLIRLITHQDGVTINDRPSQYTHTRAHAHNRLTALLEFVWDYPGEQVPER